jgi:hypothetical protein
LLFCNKCSTFAVVNASTKMLWKNNDRAFVI